MGAPTSQDVERTKALERVLVSRTEEKSSTTPALVAAKRLGVLPGSRQKSGDVQQHMHGIGDPASPSEVSDIAIDSSLGSAERVAWNSCVSGNLPC